MLNSYNITSQSISENSDVVFTQNSILIGNSITHTAGTSTVYLSEPGLYFVTFNATATASTASETDPITVQLYDGDTAVSGASASALSSGTANNVNLSFSTIIRVGRSCCVVDNTAGLVVTNTGAAATFSNANIVVKKVY